MRVLRVEQSATRLHLTPAVLPHRDAREKGPADVIPATAFWLAALPEESMPEPAELGNHLMVVLSGRLRLTAGDHGPETLGPGDVVCAKVDDSGLVSYRWEGEAWLFFAVTPGWLPESGKGDVRAMSGTRGGPPLRTWIRDSEGSSRSEPFGWPPTPTSVPPVDRWPASVGAFVTRRDYGDDGYVPGKWHNGPRRQLGITLNGRAENETADGTITSPVAGDLAFIDDATGSGHLTRGEGDRWMLFVAVAPGHLDLVPGSRSVPVP